MTLLKPTILSLLKLVDPHPIPTPNPNVNPTTNERWIPFHAAIADHLNPAGLLPMGRVSRLILQEMIAYNVHLVKNAPIAPPTNGHLINAKVFDVYSSPGPRVDDALTALDAIRCIAFSQEVIEGGQKRMDEVIDGLTWFLRDGGSIEPKICKFDCGAQSLIVNESRMGRRSPWKCLQPRRP